MKGRRRLATGLLLVVVTIGAFVAPAGATPSQTPTPQAWTINGAVLAVEQIGGRIYAGGTFTRVGPPDGHALVLNPTTGAIRGPSLSVNGTVQTIVPDGFGGWYLGGLFSYVNGVARTNAARVSSNGSVLPFAPEPNGIVNAIVRKGSFVALGGEFTSVTGGPRSNLAVVNADSGGATAAVSDANGPILAATLKTDTQSIYVAGSFTTINGVSRARLARVSLATGAVDSTFNGAVNNTVNAVAYDIKTDRVYIGGTFTSISVTARKNLAALAGASGANISTWQADTNAPVNAITIAEDSRVLVGGAFTSIAGQTRRFGAMLDSAGALKPWLIKANGAVTTISITGDQASAYLGGGFTLLGSTPANGAGLVDMVSGTPTSSFKVAPNHPVRVVLADPSGVLIGGEFSSITSVARQNLVAINASTGAADMSAIPSADGAVRAFARSVDGSTLYVAGSFTHIGSVARNHLAAIDVASGSVTSFNPNVDGEVAALTVRGSSLYLGGTFSHVGGLNALNAARISLGSSLRDATWTPSPDRGVNAIALSPDGDTVYLGGAFVNVGADSRPYLAAVKTQGGALTDWRPSTPKLVFAVAVQSDGSIYAGTGGKSEAGNNVIKYRPNGDSPEVFRVHGDGDVQALRLSPDENTLYVGGHMHNLITPYAAPRAQTYSMATSDGSITSWAPDLDIRFKGVWALDVTATTVILAGQFTRIGPTVAEGLAIFPGTP